MTKTRNYSEFKFVLRSDQQKFSFSGEKQQKLEMFGSRFFNFMQKLNNARENIVEKNTLQLFLIVVFAILFFPIAICMYKARVRRQNDEFELLLKEVNVICYEFLKKNYQDVAFEKVGKNFYTYLNDTLFIRVYVKNVAKTDSKLSSNLSVIKESANESMGQTTQVFQKQAPAADEGGHPAFTASNDPPQVVNIEIETPRTEQIPSARQKTLSEKEVTPVQYRVDAEK